MRRKPSPLPAHEKLKLPIRRPIRRKPSPLPAPEQIIGAFSLAKNNEGSMLVERSMLTMRIERSICPRGASVRLPCLSKGACLQCVSRGASVRLQCLSKGALGKVDVPLRKKRPMRLLLFTITIGNSHYYNDHPDNVGVGLYFLATRSPQRSLENAGPVEALCHRPSEPCQVTMVRDSPGFTFTIVITIIICFMIITSAIISNILFFLNESSESLSTPFFLRAPQHM